MKPGLVSNRVSKYSTRAEALGVARSTVSQWKKRFRQYGLAGLKVKPHPGPTPKLTERQRKKLSALLLKGATKNGFHTESWTLKRVAAVIQKQFGVKYDPSSVWHLLKRLGWSCQKPERRARERDEDAIARWRKSDWPRIKKARTTGPSIVFIDESGFMLQPTVRRTWTPKGQTPIHNAWDRRDRLSAISAVTVSPKRQRRGLYFALLPQDENIHAEGVVDFLRQLKRHIPGPITLVWNRGKVHDRSCVCGITWQSIRRSLLRSFPAMRRNSTQRRVSDGISSTRGFPITPPGTRCNFVAVCISNSVSSAVGRTCCPRSYEKPNYLCVYDRPIINAGVNSSAALP